MTDPTKAHPLLGLFTGLAILLLMVGGVVGVVIGVVRLSEPKASAPSPPPADKVELPAEPPLFAQWPSAKPDLALVLTGEMHGYLRPCGCSPDQQGGLARRGGFLRYLSQEKGWNVVPIDLGDLIIKRTPWEAKRYAYALESLQSLGYPAIGIGPHDLALSMNTVLGEAVNLQKAKLVNANLSNKEADTRPLWEEFVPPVVVKDARGVKLGVGAAMSDSIARDLSDPSVTLSSPTPALARILERMEKEKVDLRVLLAWASAEEAKKWAEAVPGFDVILCQSSIEESAAREATMVGKTMVTWVGRKGKSVGVLGWWRSEEPRLRFEIAPLDRRYGDDPDMNEIYARFVSALKDGRYAEKTPRTLGLDEYVGAKRCGECHKKAFAKWSTTKHSHALESLQQAEPKGQDYNPECLLCHTTGFESKTGFVTPSLSAALGGNQCENCHGPGKKHSEQPKDQSLIASMRRSRSTIEPTCRQCHDAENSIHFNFQTYWPKVEHYGKD